jgi:H+/gluconate symporter-like permease
MDKKILIGLLIASLIFLVIVILMSTRTEVKEVKEIEKGIETPEQKGTQPVLPEEEEVIEVPIPVKIEE